MKINGPGQPPAAGVTDAESTKPASEAPGSGPTGESGRAFADKLDRPVGAMPGAMPGATTAPSGGVAVADLAAELQAGRLTSRAAVDELVNRIVTQQLGPQAPAGVREQVRATLQDALESDPLLADKLRQLG
jgi:hypothetical protein